MIEILGLIFGGLFRLAPEVLKLREQQQQREHELKMLDAQLKVDEARGKMELQKVEVQGEIAQAIAEMQAMVTASTAQVRVERTGNRVADVLIAMVEVLSASVRPVLTYWFCVVAYGSFKAASLHLLLEQDVRWSEAITQLWTSQDHAVMLSIIGFWFVDRALRKFRP